MFLVAGLGNPGQKYAMTQHNVGFLAVDALAARWKAGGPVLKKFQSEIVEASFGGRKVLLQKPQTYMNLCGNAIQELCAFYKLDPQTQLLVISDDLDLPKGRPRLRKDGSAGGHNGLKSIESHLGPAYMRLRLGIGRDEHMPSDVYVLSRISADDLEKYKKTIEVVVTTVELLIETGFEKAMEYCNKRWPWV